ncbi:MAG: TolC family protein [Rhizobacter sp.]|nr:TolC family protein [Rhizobacter sp.]
MKRQALWLSTLAVAVLAAQPAFALDLVESWQAALQHDREFAVARAASLTAQPRRDQANALWRPRVMLTATGGVASNETQTQGAQFETPTFGRSNDVAFSTSVTSGTLGRWAVTAQQPLYNPERRAQQQQLDLSANLAELEWQAAQQALILRTASRYFDVALAQESVRVLQQQREAVERATTEAQDRFKMGASPITDTHEAQARLAGIRAQVLAAESDLKIKQGLLADSTGLPATSLSTRLPRAQGGTQPMRALEAWLDDTTTRNPQLRMQQLAADLAQADAKKYSLRSSASVDLVAQAGRERLSGSGDFGNASNTATNRMVGIQLSVPLFTGGYRSARETEALRLADKAQAEAERTRQDVAQQTRATWLGLQVGAERVQALDEALKAGTSRRDATQVGRQVGDRTTLDVLNAQNDTAQARLAVSQARVALLLDRLRLAALAGQLDASALQAVNQDLGD